MRLEALDPALDALEGLAREGALEIGSAACMVSVLDGGRPFLRAEAGLPLTMVAGQEAPLLDSLCLLVAGRTRPLIVEDAQRHSEARVSRTLRRLGIRSCLGFPLSRADRLLGSFCVSGEGRRPWTSDEVELAERLASIATVELEARLRDTPRDELDIELDPLRASIDAAFAHTAELEEAVGNALEALCLELAFDVAGAWAVDGQGTELRCVGHWHRPSPDLDAFGEVCRELSFAAGEDVVGSVWEKQEPIWSPELPPSSVFPRAAIAAAAGLSCASWTPLVAGLHPLGALEMLAMEARPLHARTAPKMADLGCRLAELIALRRDEEGLPSSRVGPAQGPTPRGPFTGLPEPEAF
jgi:hypothetical protein